MIGYENTLGTVEISQEYFANLIGMAASECYGVAGMINSTYQGLRYAITKSDVPDKGVRVKTTDGKLIVDIHIAVTYTASISAPSCRASSTMCAIRWRNAPALR